jgi:hypothetical protein
MAQDELNSVQKKDLAREFFNYWDSADWKKNGTLIKLSAEINKWTQREISNKHNPRQAKKTRGAGSQTLQLSKLHLEAKQKRDEHKREAECQYANHPHYR